MRRRSSLLVAFGVSIALVSLALGFYRAAENLCPGAGYAMAKRELSGYVPSSPTGDLSVMQTSAGTRLSAPISTSSVIAQAPKLPPISNDRPAFGVATPGGPLARGELDEVSHLVGESPSSVMFYQDFLQPPPITALNAARARAAVPLVTWEPWAWGGGVEQPAFALKRIAAGDFDGYIAQWGYALAAWGHPLQLRFAHEMNGNWYPWAEQVNSNHPGDYVEAWKHVHDVVAETGANNVSWVWSPNVPNGESTDLAALYPGPDYVDIVALDGYNWGRSPLCGGWVSPRELFAPGLAQLRSLAPGVPILVAETASSEAGGSKPAWITELLAYLSEQPDVIGFVWFHVNKEEDWRINSSDASVLALYNALRSRRMSD